MISFRAAAEAGADMVELDVRFTKDGVAVISHDARVNRCTNAKGRIVDFTLAELQKLDAGSWFHPDFYEEYIPTLEEVLIFCRNKVAVNIEIKALDQSGAAGVMEVVRGTGMKSSVIISSFDPAVLAQFRQYDANLLLALLHEGRGTENGKIIQRIKDLRISALHVYHRTLSARFLNLIKEHQLPYQVFTVNRINIMKRFLQKGAAGIITNYPDRLVRLLSEKM